MGSFQKFTYSVNSSATHEMFESSWYHNGAYQLWDALPFFLRGGGNYIGYNSGILQFQSQSGYLCWDRTFRLILTPT